MAHKTGDVGGGFEKVDGYDSPTMKRGPEEKRHGATHGKGGMKDGKKHAMKHHGKHHSK